MHKYCTDIKFNFRQHMFPLWLWKIWIPFRFYKIRRSKSTVRISVQPPSSRPYFLLLAGQSVTSHIRKLPADEQCVWFTVRYVLVETGWRHHTSPSSAWFVKHFFHFCSLQRNESLSITLYGLLKTPNLQVLKTKYLWSQRV